MDIHVVTLFSEAFESFLSSALLGKAAQKGLVRTHFVNPRAFTHDRHRSVDDQPYGGGAGMLLKPGPIVDAIESVEPRPYRVLLCPQGRPLDQKRVRDLARRDSLMLVCGRYEGVDERVRDYVDLELSLGDFVLNGGEIAAMAVIEAVTRLQPGAIGNSESLEGESYADGLLGPAHYTRPPEFRGERVPAPLLSGNHREIARWRAESRLARTAERRPEFAGGRQHNAASTYLALIHFPITDRTGKIVTTSVTNLDIHDIARSARVYGLAGYYIVTPITAQRALVERIISHWHEGGGARADSTRAEALKLVALAASLTDVIESVTEREGLIPAVIATTAEGGAYKTLPSADILRSPGPRVLLCGTGWGLAPSLLESATAILEPLRGATDYRHLSVRSAAAIILDRLFGVREEQ